MAMTEQQLAKKFRNALCGEFEIVPAGLNRFAVHSPFTFDDGDHYVTILELRGDRWTISDEGHTFMHMSYLDVDFQSGTRERVINESLDFHGIECADGVLSLAVPSEDQIGHAMYSFVHGLTKIVNVTKFTREIVKSTFLEDFKDLLSDLADGSLVTFNWADPIEDTQGLYTVDCRIEGGRRPWSVFAIHSDDKCKNATITCLKRETINIDERSIAIFEDQSSLNSRSVARLTDVVSKSFSSLGDRQRIERYFDSEVLAG